VIFPSKFQPFVGLLTLGKLLRRFLAVVAATLVTLAVSSSLKAGFIISYSRYSSGSNDVVVFSALNDGTGAQAGTVKLQALNLTVTAVGSPLIFNYQDEDGDGATDANVKGVGYTFPTSSGSTMPGGTFVRVGSTSAFFIPSGGTSPAAFTDPDGDGIPNGNNPVADYTNLQAFSLQGSIPGGGVAANVSPAPFAVAVVASGAEVRLTGNFAAEQGSIVTSSADSVVPEPTTLSSLAAFAAAALLRRRRRNLDRKKVPTFRSHAEGLEQRLILSASPSVLSINRTTPSLATTSAAAVTYTVTFNGPVTGVVSSDFSLATTGTVADTGISVSDLGAHSIYSVTVNGISGAGTLGLNLVDNGAIRDLATGNPLQASAATAGTFQSQQTFATNTLPYAVATGDLYGDGHTEIVVANNTSGNLTVYSVAPTGAATLQATYTTIPAQSPWPISTAITSSTSSSAMDWEASPPPSFPPPPTTSIPPAPSTSARPPMAYAVDVNNDGKVDLICADYTTNSIGVLLGNGDGTFQTVQSVPLGTGSTRIKTADITGSVFEIVHGTNAISTLAVFADEPHDGGAVGQFPSGVILDSAGNLYGTTAGGGKLGQNGEGTVFELAHGSSEITFLALFTDPDSIGDSPIAGLTLDGAGNLFGTARGGENGDGTIFEIAHGTNTISLLASFDGTNGSIGPGRSAAPILDASGNLFGTTQQGGATGQGTVYELPYGSHEITTLVTFNGFDGSEPLGGLTLDGAGNLFGTSLDSDRVHGNLGTVFEISPTPPSFSLVTPPASDFAGAPLNAGTGVQAAITYSWGNPVPTDTSTVTLTLHGGVFSTGSNTATVAAVNGVATFAGLVINTPGTYTITAADGSYAPVTSANFTIGAAGNSVTGTVFNDANNNAAADGGDSALAGVTVTLTPTDGSPISVNTTSDGYYFFGNVPAGTYAVSETLPSGYALTTPLGSSTITVADGQAATGPSYGDVQISTVTLGFNMLVALSQGYLQAGTFANGDLNGDGTVNFYDLVLLSQNYQHTLPVGDYNYVSQGTSQQNAVVNLSTKALHAAAKALTSSGSIGGTIFNDANADGAQETGEKGLAGRTVYLRVAGAGTKGQRTAATNTTGGFTFTGVAAGNYVVVAQTPTGWRTTGALAGADAVTLAAGAKATAPSFGQTQLAMVSGSVYLDANKNGTRQTNETGLAGWTVTRAVGRRDIPGDRELQRTIRRRLFRALGARRCSDYWGDRRSAKPPRHLFRRELHGFVDAGRRGSDRHCQRRERLSSRCVGSQSAPWHVLGGSQSGGVKRHGCRAARIRRRHLRGLVGRRWRLFDNRHHRAAGRPSAAAAPAIVSAVPYYDTSTSTGSGLGMHLIWDNTANNEEGYRISRSDTTVDGIYTVVGTVGPDVTEFDDTNVPQGSSHFYKVTAFSGEDGSDSNPVPVYVPDAPTNLTATRDDTGAIDLAWNGNACQAQIEMSAISGR
jgi:uncharacterized repeat protein (TIGR03803 family)